MKRHGETEIEAAAWQLSSALESMAKEQASKGDIYGVTFLCTKAQAIRTLIVQVNRRFS